ncbi:hypothetical protein MA16_Dca008172 [Dendrobium catenatum]|uniref:Uncharacterized protein n=1 Tax=Dendrobium catenatum TaxID=906689 RepID=A0A2I0XA33_9ASPA|nr:hypothetical protein MA16_Dca008172 [Dendrobium catenatum]
MAARRDCCSLGMEMLMNSNRHVILFRVSVTKEGRESGSNIEDDLPGATKESVEQLEEDDEHLAQSNLCDSLTSSLS